MARVCRNQINKRTRPPYGHHRPQAIVVLGTVSSVLNHGVMRPIIGRGNFTRHTQCSSLYPASRRQLGWYVGAGCYGRVVVVVIGVGSSYIPKIKKNSGV